MKLLIGKRYRPFLAQSLGALGIETFWLPDNRDVDPRLAGHADLAVFAAGNHIIAARGVYPYIVNILTNRGYTIEQAEREQSPEYPEDVGLCVCTTGKYNIYDPETIDPAVLPLLSGKPVEVRQGYARCAATVVDDHSIVTSDAGVSSAAKKAGMDVLLIGPGHIRLEGYNYGFIGGASFKLNNNVVFTGKLDDHPDKERIYGFLAQHGQKPLFLTDKPIFDIGGAIALP